MADISCDIVVVGAGVLGLCVATELTARGRDVRVIDPGLPNASSIAAGMIAPAFESLLDGVDGERAALLREAADLWPAFASRSGLTLDAAAAEWRGDAAATEAGLTALGFSVERVNGGLRAPQDIRIDAASALADLAAALTTPILVAEARSAQALSKGWRVMTTDAPIIARQLVIATGASGALAGLPNRAEAAISGVRPIAGQIGRVSHPLTDHVLRSTGGYVVPGGEGALIGATMVPDSRDPTPDPVASERLRRAAQTLLNEPLDGPIDWRGAVRGATPDGLPLGGPVGDDLHLALAPRRNGWLLGPLVARVVADGIEGRPRGPHAAALDPLRFSPREG